MRNALMILPILVFVLGMPAIGPIEEFAKLLPFLLIVVRFDEFDAPLDGIIYALFLGLGCARFSMTGR